MEHRKEYVNISYYSSLPFLNSNRKITVCCEEAVETCSINNKLYESRGGAWEIFFFLLRKKRIYRGTLTQRNKNFKKLEGDNFDF